ncbi:MAG: 1-deoxy-D-xylulose-5-phosphate reductoisomerase [Betaproteobacteria bacterium RIFCSPLOWO2_12_FULL_65_14]|nr:MAG: 1-deoxy-D-xylulose-5-phosphate reductoisomerase [Betaproteobacteria bacterium RIFCSPLOWO2_12_FULL_65_14]
MSAAKNIAILGATGSIGRSTLDVVARHPDRFRVVALTALGKVDELAALCSRFAVPYAAIADAGLCKALQQRLAQAGAPTRVLAGEQGLIEAATLPEVECVMAAIVGAAGLRPTLAAAAAGKQILLANKEALVMAGPIFMDTVRRHQVALLPIDSEHNAIFQCLPAFALGKLDFKGIRRILLTGSGGPFRTRSRTDLQRVTPEEACAHPNWVMGRKISVDSATMMNKGLEVIEAHWLFGARADQIEVVVHPQSVVHSMVEYADGSVLAQLGNPDMRTPIAQALAYPDRIEAGVAGLDLLRIGSLTFEEPDFGRFPALRLAYSALQAQGSAPTVLNAANEVAVAAFLDGELPFLGISGVIEETLSSAPVGALESLEGVLEVDRSARFIARQVISRMTAEAQ